MCNKQCKWRPITEDHIFMGVITYGRKCVQCGKEEYNPPGPLELGTYK